MCLLSFKYFPTCVKNCERTADWMKREMCSFECSLVPTLWTKKYLPSSVTTTKRFLILKWIFERRLIVTDGSFENWVISLGWYSRISPSFSCGIFDHMPRLDPSRTLKHIWWIVNIYIYINEVLHSSCHINLVFCYASEFFPKIQTQLRLDFFYATISFDWRKSRKAVL